MVPRRQRSASSQQAPPKHTRGSSEIMVAILALRQEFSDRISSLHSPHLAQVPVTHSHGQASEMAAPADQSQLGGTSVPTQEDVQLEVTHASMLPPVASLSQVPSVESTQAAQVDHYDDPYLVFMKDMASHMASMERKLASHLIGQLQGPREQHMAPTAPPLPTPAAVEQAASMAVLQPDKDLESGSGSGQHVRPGGQAGGSVHIQRGLGGPRPHGQAEGSAQTQQDEPGGSGPSGLANLSEQDGAWISGVWY